MKISKSTIKTIVFIFGLFTNISSFASQDTLLIKRKNKKYIFEYKGIKDTITENGLIIIDENSNFHYFIDNWKHHFDKKEKQIIIPIVIHTNPFNNSFYSSNFSGIKESIDSSVSYKSINLGNYIIKFDKKKKLTFKIDFINYTYLNLQNPIKLRNEYDRLLDSQEYASFDCENWEKAYELFNLLTWESLCNNLLNPNEYKQLDRNLTNCLGAEYSEDFLEFSQLINLKKND